MGRGRRRTHQGVGRREWNRVLWGDADARTTMASGRGGWNRAWPGKVWRRDEPDYGGFCKEYNIGVDSPGMGCYKAAIAARPLIWRARYPMGSSSHTAKA